MTFELGPFMLAAGGGAATLAAASKQHILHRVKWDLYICRGSSLSAATGIPTNRSMLHIPTSTTASIVLLTLLQEMSVEIDIRLISPHAIASTLDYNKSYNEATDTRK